MYWISEGLNEYMKGLHYSTVGNLLILFWGGIFIAIEQLDNYRTGFSVGEYWLVTSQLSNDVTSFLCWATKPPGGIADLTVPVPESYLSVSRPEMKPCV